MLLNAAVVTILTALLYTYITQLYLHYAAVTSAMLLNAAAATILTALLILTLRSYTYIT